MYIVLQVTVGCSASSFCLKMSDYVLQWAEFEYSRSKWMNDLLLSKERTDCTLSCGIKYIPVHRVVLASCSTYFRALFSSVPGYQHPAIVIRDVEDYVLDLLVQYMYCGSFGVSLEHLDSFVKAARSLSIEDLKDLVIQLISDSLNY